MKFIKKAEYFFSQTQYALVIDPEPIFIGTKGFSPMMLEPFTFFKLMKDFDLEYPFIIENKIFELKKAMELDQIDPSEAVAICQRFKDHYWFMDAPEMFSEIEQAHKKALQDYYFRYDLKITNKEIEKEFFNYVKYLIKRRNRIFEDLIIQLNSSISQHNESKKIKEFSEYLFHHKRDQLAEELKKEFEGSKGKNIKLMLMSLQEKGLGSFFGNRQFKSVFDSMTAYFPWNIGTYPSINDYKNDKVGYEAINSKVTFIINQLESTNK